MQCGLTYIRLMILIAVDVFHGMIEVNPHSSNFVIRAYCDWLFVLGIVGPVATVVLGDVSRSHVRIMDDEHS